VTLRNTTDGRISRSDPLLVAGTFRLVRNRKNFCRQALICRWRLCPSGCATGNVSDAGSAGSDPRRRSHNGHRRMPSRARSCQDRSPEDDASLHATDACRPSHRAADQRFKIGNPRHQLFDQRLLIPQQRVLLSLGQPAKWGNHHWKCESRRRARGKPLQQGG
jgi:hypothetical protein